MACAERMCGEPVLSIPDGAKRLQAGLVGCARMIDSGNRDVSPTLMNPWSHCIWSSIQTAVQRFIRESFRCAESKGGTIFPHSRAESPHGAVVGEVLLVNFFHSEKSELDGVVSEETEIAYLLVIVEDMSGFIWSKPVPSCTAAATT